MAPRSVLEPVVRRRTMRTYLGNDGALHRLRWWHYVIPRRLLR